MSGAPPIEALGRSDATDLRALSQAVGWTHTSDDWRTILDVGRVYGHRADDGGFASSGALFEYGAAFASIGMILVAPAYRGRGLARAMMRHCVAVAGTRSVTLIATAQGEPLYRSLGFIDVERVCRVLIAGGLGGGRLASITTRDVESIITFDANTFGADRRVMLAALLSRAEATALVDDAGGGVRGFGLAARQSGRFVIGPVVARETDDALALVRSLALDAGGEIRLEVPTRQTRLLEMLAALGGRRIDDAPVMLYGATAMPGRREGIYALASRGLG